MQYRATLILCCSTNVVRAASKVYFFFLLTSSNMQTAATISQHPLRMRLLPTVTCHVLVMLQNSVGPDGASTSSGVAILPQYRQLFQRKSVTGFR